MNEIIKNIMSRRSCRCFDPERMPSEEILQQIAEAGTWAPTGMGLQNPIIIIVTNQEMRERIRVMNARFLGSPESDPFYGAPCMAIVVVKNWYNAFPDGANVLQTMMLAATSLGVNSCWINRAKEEFETEEGKAILKDLGIEGDYVGVGHLALGYATKQLPEPKQRKEDYIRWIK